MSHETDVDLTRKIYLAFKNGAGLQRDDIKRLLESHGRFLSNNQITEFGRASRVRGDGSTRGGVLTLDILRDLVSAWSEEQSDRRYDGL